MYDEAGSGPVYQPSDTLTAATTPEPPLLTTTRRIMTNVSPEEEGDAEMGDGDTENDNSDDNNRTNEKINPFLMSAFNMITNGILSAIKSRQSNPDEGRTHVENKGEELNKGMDNESELIDVSSSTEASDGTGKEDI